MKKLLSAGLIFLVFGYNAQAQTKIPYTISILNEATSMPFTQLFTTPVHPGFEFGREVPLNKSFKHNLYLSFNIGYIFHKNLFQGVYFQTRFNYDYRLKCGFSLKSSLGLGYLHTFSTQREFVLNKGEYVSRADKGNSRIMPSLGLGIGFKPKPSSLSSPEIFMIYNSWIEYPYSPGFIPLMSHSTLQIGSRFFISKSSSNK